VGRAKQENGAPTERCIVHVQLQVEEVRTEVLGMTVISDR
jgi:hypothetical protein